MHEGSTMRTHTLRTGAAVLAGGLVVAGLAACGGDSSGGDADLADIPAEGVDDGTTLTMWSRAPLERQATNAVEAYNASHENQGDLQIIPNDDVEGKVGSAAQTDSLPDLLAGDVVRVPYWPSEGIFMDTTDLINTRPTLDDLQSGHIEAGTIDGGLHSRPFVTDISVMVWNKDLYEEAGLDPEQGPTTVAEFVDQASAGAGVGVASLPGSARAGQYGGAPVVVVLRRC